MRRGSEWPHLGYRWMARQENMTMSTQQTNASAGVSLVTMQAQLEKMAAELAETKAAAAAKPQLRTPTAAAPKPAHVPTYQGKGKLTAPPKAAETGRKASTTPCGAKSPKGLCTKCNGPFNPILHYTMDAVKAMDGKPLDTSKLMTTTNLDGRAFIGVSTDDKYWGNVVLVGFGRDTINLRPKTFLRLAHAIGAFKAADHVMAVLPESMYQDDTE